VVLNERRELMSGLSDALSRWQHLLDIFQQQNTFRPALTGDGSSAGTADVTGRTGWAWVRYDEKLDHVSQVVNWRFPGIAQGVPVMVGKQYPTDRYFQILGVNLDLYLDNMTPSGLVAYILPKHGDSHHGGTGSDAIDLRNFVFGRVSADTPESLFVSVSAFSYDDDGSYVTYAGELLDLSGDLPGTSGYHAYALVYVDSDTNALGYEMGDAVPVAMTPSIPAVEAGMIPLGVVRLENAATTIAESDIFDYRIVLNPVGGNLDVINQIVGALEAEHDMLISRHVVEGL
jgi:hypothetical protein